MTLPPDRVDYVPRCPDNPKWIWGETEKEEPMNCTRCQRTGFLNVEQLPDGLLEEGIKAVGEWITNHQGHDVMVCDCCGNGEDTWYGIPGEHYNSDDPIGRNGPYAYNGGLCECH